MPEAPVIQFTVRVDDSQLLARTAEMARATGRTIAEQSRLTMKALVKYVLTYTPPASQKAQGKAAQTAGELAVVRDMKKLFYAVDFKGKPTEKFPDPGALHQAAFASGALVPPSKRYHVDKAKITALKTTLQHNIGLLASGWAPSANTLGVPMPAWITRWAGSGRGTNLITTERGTKLNLKVTNHMPGTARVVAAQTQRLVESAKRAQVNSMQRQLPYILKRALRGH